MPRPRLPDDYLTDAGRRQRIYRQRKRSGIRFIGIELKADVLNTLMEHGAISQTAMTYDPLLISELQELLERVANDSCKRCRAKVLDQDS